jgi:hypothetical protein
MSRSFVSTSLSSGWYRMRRARSRWSMGYGESACSGSEVQITILIKN